MVVLETSNMAHFFRNITTKSYMVTNRQNFCLRGPTEVKTKKRQGPKMIFAPPKNTYLAQNFRTSKDNSILMTYLKSLGRKQLEQPQKTAFYHLPISFYGYLSEKHTILKLAGVKIILLLPNFLFFRILTKILQRAYVRDKNQNKIWYCEFWLPPF